jgi:CspA family cold shock protein
MDPQIAVGRVKWFSLIKQFGFLVLEDGAGDAFLHVSVLKAAGYVSVPAGTTMRVTVDHEQGGWPRVVEVVEVDITTAIPGQSAPLLRKRRQDSTEA